MPNDPTKGYNPQGSPYNINDPGYQRLLLPHEVLGGGAVTTSQRDSLFAAGLMMPYAGDTPPDGWLLCNGQSLKRNGYPRLFRAIGTKYGAVDDGSFNVPDARGRTLVGYDASQSEFDTLGKTGGTKTNTHNHWTGSSFDGGGIYITNTPNLPRTRVIALDHNVPIGASNTGGNTRQDSTYDETISVLSPYNTVNIVIKY